MPYVIRTTDTFPNGKTFASWFQRTSVIPGVGMANVWSSSRAEATVFRTKREAERVARRRAGWVIEKKED